MIPAPSAVSQPAVEAIAAHVNASPAIAEGRTAYAEALTAYEAARKSLAEAGREIDQFAHTTPEHLHAYADALAVASHATHELACAWDALVTDAAAITRDLLAPTTTEETTAP